MRKKDPAKKQLILDCAAQLIAQDGAGALSTARVARAVGIAQSNIYIYFKDRDALLAAVFDRAQAAGAQYIDGPLIADETKPMAARLQAYLRGLYDWSVAAPTDMLLLEQIKRLPDAPATTHIGNTRTEPLMDLIRQAQSAGLCRPVAADILVTIVFAAVRRNVELPQKDQASFAKLFPVLWAAIATTPAPNVEL
ncbi:TetR/AcrR family transcriptional regulator [Lacticaseibacillus pantheris]|jgi:AcrR family transcriptional regulator|uniref:HTH tetR-type domain-containing protein n=1 Tax=Lacticaseibacillus pantheris DSM 15945 = JCM 12539 = NBRC 106106 TaxID=1423783 RepID=A0A0R1TZV5_9LACO|nr:TetR/AcrR family transcriptional regulator [Lacticaseibacillus pantheris]KRL84650.1 hypothetical protein FC50_GL001960 [Lacticaseibacillus pantheris DSM 15945 = JCM 12539 = NBRC 106106]WKF85798.1 TetR/AcrR family transcriptional regulator [Lacticaseibacillus pantheris]